MFNPSGFSGRRDQPVLLPVAPLLLEEWGALELAVESSGAALPDLPLELTSLVDDDELLVD
jgi:hypothetical protein